MNTDPIFNGNRSQQLTQFFFAEAGDIIVCQNPVSGSQFIFVQINPLLLLRLFSSTISRGYQKRVDASRKADLGALKGTPAGRLFAISAFVTQ